MKGPVVLVFGTRPEIIKLSALMRILEKKKYDYRLIHTGQHYSYSMDRVFFRQLGLPKPHYALNMKTAAGEKRMGYVTRVSKAIEAVLRKERPGVVLVQGDTNSVLAGALAARRVRSRIGHVEAGLRSYDRSMPEELNRIRTDGISDYLFAPTVLARDILLKEGTNPEKIVVTGNTVVDAVIGALPMAKKSVSLARWVKPGEKHFLLTLHRQENVDSAARLGSIVRALEAVCERWDRRVIFPVHPRTKAKLTQFGLRLPRSVKVIEPLGFLEFLRLQSSAELVLTDSGGVQEESCILRVPCVTLRTTTERPETVSVGANIVAGFLPAGILAASKKMLEAKKDWKNPFGDGCASERILKTVEERS